MKNLEDAGAKNVIAVSPLVSEAPCGKPRGIFAEPCEAKNVIPTCGKPQGFLAKKGAILCSHMPVFRVLCDLRRRRSMLCACPA